MVKKLTEEEKKANLSKYLIRLLKTMQEKAGWKYNQARLSRDMGITQSMLSKYMSGELLPGRDTLAKIVAFTHSTEVYELVGIRLPDEPKARLLEMIAGWPNASKETQERMYRVYIGEEGEDEVSTNKMQMA